MVFDFLRRAEKVAPERKASATGRVVAFGTQGRVAWSPRDVVSLTRNGFQGNPIGFRAVKLIAEAAAALPLVLQDAERRYDTHPLLDLIRRPNPAQGRAEMFEAVYAQLLLSGNAYLEAVPGLGNLPGELHVLRSDRMALVPGADGWPVAYDYTVGNARHRFSMTGDVQPICHIRSFHPQDDHYGFSPLQAAAVALDVHGSASAWSKALLDNAARPSGAIVYKGLDGQGQLSPDQYDRLVGPGGADQAAQVAGVGELAAAVDHQQVVVGRLQQCAALGGQHADLVGQQRESGQDVSGGLHRSGEQQHGAHGSSRWCVR